MRTPPLDPSLFTFSPTAGTVTFAAGATRPTHQAQIVSIVNVSSEVYLYLPVQAGRGGTYDATTGVLTLEIGTATMSSGNALQIVIDDSEIGATSTLQAAGNTLQAAINAALGAPADAAATSDTGTFALVPLQKRALTLLTALSAKIPQLTLTGTRLQVNPTLGPDASTATNQVTTNTALGITNDRLGVTGTGAPTLPSGASGLAGLVQVFYQALLDRLPASLSSGRLLVSPSLGVVGEDSFSASGAISINTQLLLRDCSDCSAVSIQVPSMGTGGAIAAEWSNNGTNFGTASTASTGSGSQTWGSITGAGLFVIPRLGKWLQLRMSIAASGGTTSLSIALLADSPMVNAVAQLNGGSTQIVGSVVQGYSASATFASSTKTSIFSAASTNAAVIKGSGGKVLGYWLTNTTANHIMVRLYNLATAPNVGSSTTFTRITVPPNGTIPWNLEGGYLHNSGIAIAITAGLADNDSTAVTAGAIIGELFTI